MSIANPKQIKVGGSRLGKFGVMAQLSDCKKSVKRLLIVFKARKTISKIKSLKVRCKKDGECDFKRLFLFTSPLFACGVE